MGGLAAIISKSHACEDLAKTVVTMLKMLKQKSVKTYGIASPTIVKIEKSIERLQIQDLNSHVLVGHVFSRTFVSDTPQPRKLDYGTLAFEGRICSLNMEISNSEFVAEKLNKNPENTRILIKNFEGNFAFAVAEPKRIIVGRDSLGTYPLYYGENTNVAALASQRKALWKIGITEAYSFPPGHIAVVDEYGFRFKPVKTLSHVTTRSTNMQVAVKKLRNLLQQSVKQTIFGLEKVAVAFSGGLDSSIIAFLARKFGADVHLVSVSLRNQPETEATEEAAEALKLPLHIYSYTERAVEKALPKVLWLIEEANPIKTSIGIPVFWIAEKSSEMGYKAVLAGQGADELFGGYKRYLNDYRQHGAKFAQKTIFNDITNMYELNFERDSKICNYSNVKLCLPFATFQLAKFAANMPLQLKIESPNDKLRKKVLRKAAEDLGLPHFIVNKPKKAIQYATGVNRILKKLAKKKGSSMNEYLQKIFQRTFERII